MVGDRSTTPGLLVVSHSITNAAQFEIDAVRAVVPSDAVIVSTTGEIPLVIAAWGDKPRDLLEYGSAALVRGPIAGDFRSFGSEKIASSLLSDGRPSMNDVLPPFAAVALEPEGRLVAATDHLGLRQLFYAGASGRVALSTSSSALARWARQGIDHRALAVQSLLGWQLGDRTMFDGVARVPAGARVYVDRGRIELIPAIAVGDQDAGPGSYTSHPRMTDAVDEARTMLADTLAACLDSTLDVVFQLSGGLDSRVLLAAIPADRRRGLRAMTLGERGDPDVDTAAQIAERYGMDHRVLPLPSMETWDPDDAFESAVASARRLDYVADPLSLTAIRSAEGDLIHQPRISGVGGEYARGFYQAGLTLPVSTSRWAVLLIARYRMFTNEAVRSEVLDPDFASWARRFTEDEITSLTASYDDNLAKALDEFYLLQRVQRWAGATSTAVAFDRAVVSPMLDDRFIRLVRRLPTGFKSGNRFMAAMVMRSDDELAHIPLDGRPEPAIFASPGLANRGRRLRFTGMKVSRKVGQRFRDTRRAPTGASTMVRPMTQFMRQTPAALDELEALGIFRAQWLEQFAQGVATPDAPTLAFLTNVLAAIADGRSPSQPR
jgi:asparagine synthase (glutamine-hydrolysing)